MITPKDLFLSEILEVVGKFQRETGIEVHNINFPNRIDDTLMGNIGIKTVITEIRLELK